VAVIYRWNGLWAVGGGRWADILVLGIGDASARPGMGDVQCLEVHRESGQISQLREPHQNDAQGRNGQPGMHNSEGTSTLFQSSKKTCGEYQALELGGYGEEFHWFGNWSTSRHFLT